MKQLSWKCVCSGAIRRDNISAGVITVWATYFADTKEAAAKRFELDYDALEPVEITNNEY